MGFWLQLKLLLWKNWILKRRKPVVMILETFLPVVLFLIMVAIRHKQPSNPQSAVHYEAYPLPSAGLIPIIQDFCDTKETRPLDDSGFRHVNNERIKILLGQLNNLAKHHNFFQIDLSVKEMTDLPHTYRTMTDYLIYIIEDLKKFSNVPFSNLFIDSDEMVGEISKKYKLPEKSLKEIMNISLDSILGANGTEWSSTTAPPSGRKRQIHGRATNLSLPIISILQTVYPRLVESELKLAKELAWRGKTLLCKQSIGASAPSNTSSVIILNRLCQLNSSEAAELINIFLRHLDGHIITDNLKEESIRTLLLEKSASKTFQNIKKLFIFKYVLRDLKLLVDTLGLNSCSLRAAVKGGASDVGQLTNKQSAVDSEPSSPNKLTYLRIWDAIQTHICGKTTVPTTGGAANAAAAANNDQSTESSSPEMSYRQKELIKMLFHVMSSNPKILYAPNNTDADLIIKKSNETFEFLDHITSYARTLVDVTKEINEYLTAIDTPQKLSLIIETQTRLLNASWLRWSMQELAPLLMTSREALLSQLEAVERGACTWLSLMANVTTDVFVGFRDENELLDYIKNRAYGDNITVLASLIFSMNEDGSLPRHVSYSIRQNATFTPSTNRVRPQYWYPNPTSENDKYYKSGFLWIQDIIERAIVFLHSGKDVVEPGIYVQQFPQPCYIEDSFIFIIEHVMPICLTSAWVYSVAMMVQSIVYEKEQRLKEVMKAMGMSELVHWTAWFITSLTQMTVTVTSLTLALKYGKVLPHSNPFLIFLLIEVFAISNIVFSFALSSLFSKAKIAAACAGIIYFISYIPSLYIAINEGFNYDTEPFWSKALVSLLSTSAFGIASKYIAYYEEAGVGLQINNWAVSPIANDQFSLKMIFLILLLDALLYATFVWYIQNVHPGSYGLPRPWYFPFTGKYWRGVLNDCCRICCGHNNNEHTSGGCEPLGDGSESEALCTEGLHTNSRYYEAEPTHLNRGVCIKDLVKVYKEGNKTAVNGLSMNLYEDQITSFLGHNGAGKTTTMSILTGIFPPTSGSATVYGMDIRKDMGVIRESLGMCPQHNVLFDELTVEEHLWFYAQLKGVSSDNLRTEIEKMIDNTGLSNKRNQQVDHLAGGMKRKLSVAIAFMGGSKTVILDEPTSGVDPCSRRGIWDLLLKYKKGRTILLSTHHMDEAEMLGDRIAIVSAGKLKCCGSPMYLKNTLGEGYHLFLVKKECAKSQDSESEDSGMGGDSASRANQTPPRQFYSRCSATEVTEFVRSSVAAARLHSESPYELHYVLPLHELKSGNFERLFLGLDQALERLQLKSYGVKSATLEEIFIRIVSSDGPAARHTHRQNHHRRKSGDVDFFADLGNKKQDTKLIDIEETKDLDPFEDKLTQLAAQQQKKLSNQGYHELAFNDLGNDELLSPLYQHCGTASHTHSGYRLWFLQFYAIIFKRLLCTQRNKKGLFSQVALPAIFVALAMTVALITPGLHDPSPLRLTSTQYHNMSGPGGQVVPFADLAQDRDDIQWSRDASAARLASTLHMASGLGATCVLKDANNWSWNSSVNNWSWNVSAASINAKDNVSQAYENEVAEHFEPSCQDIFVPVTVTGNYGPPAISTTIHKQLKIVIPAKSQLTSTSNTSNTTNTTVPVTSLEPRIFHPSCQCAEDSSGFVCDDWGFQTPPRFRVVSGENMLNISGARVEDYLLYTTHWYQLSRYGALSLGIIRDLVPQSFGQDAPTIFQKIAVRRVAKAWFNSKGFHSLPTFVNVLNNAILRANLPSHKGNPAAYGITVSNHPLPDTNTLINHEQLVQGTDVVISVFIIMAMAFIPASFVLILVSEQYTKSKHLQMVSGMNVTVYWVANYIWDVCNYVVPATLCIFILMLFDIPAYTSSTNLPAVISLFMLYGWSITPVMYPASFIFKVPSTAYIFLLISNLFLGITCLLTTAILKNLSYNKMLKDLHDILDRVFLIFPNYCLGKGLVDISANEYNNFYLIKTGRADEVKSPFSWEIIPIKLVAMCISGMVFFILTVLCEKKFFSRPKKMVVADSVVQNEDEDVAAERQRVNRGQAANEILQLKNLTKVYRTSKVGDCLAVDRTCVGIREGECFGLLGVNGAGKTTTFKMLTGDESITDGDALINGFSIKNNFDKVRAFFGYCPQFDALHEELTAREQLKIYACYRGIPLAEQDRVVGWAIAKLDLQAYEHRQSATYSGGNKRKLSTAIALMGNPGIIFMDEPTTGMDPYSRRFLWDIINKLTKQGRCVLLTSHSMEECEVLCSRLTIMVGGRFQCLGSVQHLKNRFGDGYSVAVKLNSTHKALPVVQFFTNAFPGSFLKDKHHNMLYFNLKSENTSLAYIFSCMESILSQLQIEDYTVCQNTLDNVFINFVRKQTANSDSCDNADADADANSTTQSISLSESEEDLDCC